MKRDKNTADGQMAEESVVEAENKETDEKDEDDDISMINVDFEFFDPNPDVDFHAFNTLLKQLFGPDAVQFDLGSLADLILSNPAMGSTVKVDGKESDPYAMLSIIPMNSSSNTNTNTNTASETNQISPVISSMRPYILSKTKKDAAFAKLLAGIMSDGSKARIGLILSERLINMPVEVVPPMYRMLAEEIQKASTDSEIYNFDYYILWSKSYQEIVSKLDEEDDRPKKKGKQNKVSCIRFGVVLTMNRFLAKRSFSSIPKTRLWRNMQRIESPFSSPDKMRKVTRKERFTISGSNQLANL